MLSTLAFDGIEGTKAWSDFTIATEPYWQPSGAFGFFVLKTLSMTLLTGAFLLIFIAFMEMVVYFGNRKLDLKATVSAFALTLVPIALVYNAAHNYSYVVVQSQGLIPLLSDPLAKGWHLLPALAAYKPSFALAQASTVWFAQIILIVVGHVIAVYLSHLKAGEKFRTARRADDAQRKQTFYFGLGLVILWVALETPIDTISDHYLDSVHMLQHVLLGFVAPPLMLLGLSPKMAGLLSRIPFVRAITEPIPAQVVAAGVMIAWHLPPLYDAALRSESLHVAEHLMFIGAGLVLYWPMLEATSAHARWQMSPAIKLLYMLVATLPQDGVALVLLFSRVPFYDFYVQAPRLVPSLTPLIDQTLAGATLMILGKAAMAIAAMAVFFRWFGGEHLEDRARLTWLR